MRHRRIGSLPVSVVGLGCNQLGTAACDGPTSLRLVAEAVARGVTLFDTSDEYGRDYARPSDLSGWGRSEELLGQALRGHRDQVVIATKFGPCGPVQDGVDATGLDQERSRASAAGVRLALEESLQRLGTDRIDLYQLHFPDPRFPLEETLTVLDELVRAGKVREIGCANFTGAELRTAADVADRAAVARFASVQNQLNLLSRRAVDDSLPACQELGLSFLPYYPLASGVLTGKYRRGEGAPAGSRLATQVTEDLRGRMLSDRTHDRLDALSSWAQACGHSLHELSIAWLLGHPPVASVIAGATGPEQLAANCAAAGWELTPAQTAEVTTLVASTSVASTSESG